MNLCLSFLSVFGLVVSVAAADGPLVLFDMDTIRHQPGTVGPQKAPIGTVELVEGKVGRACRFNFGTNNQSGFFTASVRPTLAWDQAAGLSFWVKGDGSTNWGGLELIELKNDWDAGARGPDWRDKLRLAVDRIRRLTKGRAEVLLMTTCPALARWDTMNELADATCAVAAEKRTGLAEIATAFHQHGAEEDKRAALFAWDKTHLGETGHRLAAETVFRELQQER